MKATLFFLLATMSGIAVAATVPLIPSTLECRKLIGPEFEGKSMTATALFQSDKMIYHGYWVTNEANAQLDMVRCQALKGLAIEKGKFLLLDMGLAQDGNAAGAEGRGWPSDGHWSQNAFLCIEGEVCKDE